ncbi:MAG: hypothetical protein ABJQ34_08645 [Paracoccaceae bacterium]
MLTRIAVVCALTFSAAPVFAKSAAESCSFQARVVGAIQTARLNRVPKDDVVPGLMEANPSWPKTMEQAMPALVDWIYDQRRRDLKDVDLGAVSEQQCIDNWDRIQNLTQNATN